MSVPGENPATPSGETPPNPPAPQPAPAAPSGEMFDGEPFNAERAKKLIEQQRARERELSAQLKDLKPLADRARETEEANKSELQKAHDRIAALEAQTQQAEAGRREALIRAAVEREAHAQGAVKAETVYRLLERSDIELDASGNVKGADKAVKMLLEAEPYLKAQSPNGGTVPATPRKSGDGGDRAALVKEAEDKLKATGTYTPF